MSRDAITALIYIRVSKEEQFRSGLSIPAQLDACRRYAVDHGWLLGQHFEDHMSGRRADRPGYMALLVEAQRLHRLGRRAVVVVARLDRLGRKLKEQIAFRDALVEIGTPLHVVREGGEITPFAANIMGSVAEFESQRISDRVKDIREELTLAGWWPVGRPAWGWRLRDATDGERAQNAPRRVLTEDPAGGPAVRELFERVADGESIRQAAKWAQGLDATRRGEYLDENDVLHPARRLSFALVRGLLRNPGYIARNPGPDGESPEAALARPVCRWPALVSDDLWLRVQRRIAGHQYLPRQASGSHLLTGSLWCPRCRDQGRDKRMAGGLYRGGAAGGSKYQCTSAVDGGCSYAVVGRTLEASVLDQIGSLVDVFISKKPGQRAAVRAAWDAIRSPDDAGNLQRRRGIKAAEMVVTTVQRRLREAQLRLLDGTLSSTEYPALRNDLEAQMSEAEIELARLQAIRPDPILPPLDQVVAAAGSWREIVLGTDRAAQRELLTDLVERVYPVSVRYGTYEGDITWRPLGTALAALRDATAAAV